MTWRFLGSGAPTTDQFIRGNYYATSGYFPTSGGVLTTEVASDVIQSGEWLLLCTGVTQEPRNGRLIVSFRVITDGIDVTTSNEWLNRPSGSSQYVINPTNFDRTAASKYNLINVSLSNSGIVTQADNGDFITATSEDIYDAVAAGSDEGRRHILNELSGISGIANSTVTAMRDGVTWYSAGRGYRGATDVENTEATIGQQSGQFFIEVIAPDDDLSLMSNQMIVFTVGAGTLLPAGISNNTTYTAFATTAGIRLGTGAGIAYTLFLNNVIENGTSNVIAPVTGVVNNATGVVLQAYHAQLNEEYILDPLDLIDSVDDMSAIQKTELRDAARVNFRNRIEPTRITLENGVAITDATTLTSSTNVEVTFRASGLSGVTNIVIDFNGALGRSFDPADAQAVFDSLNTGDDVEETLTVSLPALPGGASYSNDVEVDLEINEGTNVDLLVTSLGDMIGDGITGEDADLVVTPERVESAIHNTDSAGTARQDIRDTLDVYNKTEVDDAIAAGSGGDTSSLSTAMFAWSIEEVDAQDDLVLRETGTRGSAEVFRFVRVDDGSGNITYDIVATGNVRAGG